MISKGSKIMFFIFLVILIIVGEWKLKSYFEGVYDFQKQTFIFKDMICLRKYHNYGAFLNIMEKKKIRVWRMLLPSIVNRTAGAEKIAGMRKAF